MGIKRKKKWQDPGYENEKQRRSLYMWLGEKRVKELGLEEKLALPKEDKRTLPVIF